MYQQLFDEAIGSTPPGFLDIDGLIRKQRQRRRVIQVGTLAGSAAVVLAAGSLVWAAPDPRAQPAVPAPAVPAPVMPAPVSTAVDETARRLETAARNALLTVAPGATIDPGSFEMLRSGQLVPGYAGTATFSVNGRPGRISLTIMRGQLTMMCGVPSDCHTFTGPHGEKGTLTSYTGPGGGVTGCDLMVDRSAVDNTTVEINVTGIRSATGATSDVPLTVDQITQLAEDPALRAG
jgi:hypothetical protein